MYQALQAFWDPPETVTREEYADAKMGLLPPHLTAFIGFGCSFAAKWFGGYAEDIFGRRKYALSAKRACLRKIALLMDVTFTHSDYRNLRPEGALIYCDPPYNATTGYSTGAFDTAEFWSVATEWARFNTVVVSEYQGPWPVALSIPTKTEIRGRSGRLDRVERLYLKQP